MQATSTQPLSLLSEAPLHHVELFGGAGGLALGLQAAGLKLTQLIEVDPEACETLRTNGSGRRRATRGWPIEETSITDVSFNELGSVDVVSAGAPCQPFSHGGNRGGDLDARNLFPHVVQALGELHPKAFVIENVRGLLFRDMELYLRRLLRELRTPSRQVAGRISRRRGRPRDEYKLFYTLLNAADYGLPQNRQRLFIVGLKPELADEWEWPQATHSQGSLLKALLMMSTGINITCQRGFESVSATALPAGRADGWSEIRRQDAVAYGADLLSRLPEPSRDSQNAPDKWHLFVPDARLYPKHTGSRLDWPSKTVKAGVHGCPAESTSWCSTTAAIGTSPSGSVRCFKGFRRGTRFHCFARMRCGKLETPYQYRWRLR